MYGIRSTEYGVPIPKTATPNTWRFPRGLGAASQAHMQNPRHSSQERLGWPAAVAAPKLSFLCPQCDSECSHVTCAAVFLGFVRVRSDTGPVRNSGHDNIGALEAPGRAVQTPAAVGAGPEGARLEQGGPAARTVARRGWCTWCCTCLCCSSTSCRTARKWRRRRGRHARGSAGRFDERAVVVGAAGHRMYVCQVREAPWPLCVSWLLR